MPISKKSDSTKKAMKKSGLLYQNTITRGNKARRVPWNKGLVKVDFELPEDLYERIKVLAKKAGMSLERYSSILLTQYARELELEKVEERALEAALQVIARAHPDDYKRIEKELSALPSPAQKVRRLIHELSPDLEKHFRENELN
jgi:bifunctional ADP-heptose synthase (sugar kinase/adenylyltransferase)